LMKIIPHSLAAAMLAGILLRFGLQAFAGLQDHLPLCGGMLAAWLLCKALWPRFAVVAALVIGALIAAASGDVASAAVPLAFVTPEWVVPQFTPALLLSVGLPFFLVTMASQNAPGFATLQASGYTVPVSALIVVCGGLALLLAPFGVYS
ncbi:benzoate transporter, partial [Klebsiella pneumoniae]